MPWENNSNDGGRPGGPWGQIPGGGGGGNGPRRPGGNGPNIEDLFNRGRDQFRGGLPGGRMLAVIIIAVVGIFWVVNSVYQIEPNQVGVVTFLGQPQDNVSEQGLHFMLWPLARVQTVRMTQNKIDIGDGSNTRTRTDGLMLSGDQNIVNVGFSVFWRVSNPVSVLFNIRDPQEMVQRVAESAMREVVGRRPAQDVFRDNREGIQQEVQQISQDILNSYDAGITINSVQLANVAPPAEVADAFDEVQRAEQDQTRFQEEARQYANTKLGNARGQAAQIREGAAAYKNQVVKDAEGEAARFDSVYEEYSKAPDVTRRRLYYETMEKVLGESDKMIIEPGASGSGVVPYLPLNQLTPAGSSSTANQGAGQ
jgi:modulator of FtsH protease HflK